MRICLLSCPNFQNTLFLFSPNMAKNNVFLRVFRFYADGFRSMTLGKVLWTIILIKLFVIFFVLKLFFFPDVLRQRGRRRQSVLRGARTRFALTRHRVPAVFSAILLSSEHSPSQRIIFYIS